MEGEAAHHLGRVLRAQAGQLYELSDGERLWISERTAARSLKSVLSNVKTPCARLAIGPEGGWTDRELEVARQNVFREVSLGRLILRTETAVIAALAALNYALSTD